MEHPNGQAYTIMIDEGQRQIIIAALDLLSETQRIALYSVADKTVVGGNMVAFNNAVDTMADNYLLRTLFHVLPENEKACSPGTVHGFCL